MTVSRRAWSSSGESWSVESGAVASSALLGRTTGPSRTRRHS